eukprot:9784604-Karenia_brevis.AAC.1
MASYKRSRRRSIQGVIPLCYGMPVEILVDNCAYKQYGVSKRRTGTVVGVRVTEKTKRKLKQHCC